MNAKMSVCMILSMCVCGQLAENKPSACLTHVYVQQSVTARLPFHGAFTREN